MSLYDLTTEFKELISQVEAEAENADVNAEQVLLDRLSEVGIAIDSKCDNIMSLIKQLKVEEDALKQEAKALSMRAKQKSARIDSLKQWLCMNDIKSYESTAGKISTRKSIATVIDIDADLAAIYMVEKVTITPDKTKIKKAIQAGIDVKGAHLEDRESVVIK